MTTPKIQQSVENELAVLCGITTHFAQATPNLMNISTTLVTFADNLKEQMDDPDVGTRARRRMREQQILYYGVHYQIMDIIERQAKAIQHAWEVMVPDVVDETDDDGADD